MAVGVFRLGDLLACVLCLTSPTRPLRMGTASPVAREKEVNKVSADFNTETFLPLRYKAGTILGTSGVTHRVIYTRTCAHTRSQEILLMVESNP